MASKAKRKQNIVQYSNDISHIAEILLDVCGRADREEAVAEALVAEYGNQAGMKAGTFAAVLCGAPFGGIERKIGKNINQYDPGRIDALAHAAYNGLVGMTGSTRCNLQQLLSWCAATEKRAHVWEEPTPPLIIGAAISRWAHVDKEGVWLSSKAMSTAEGNIAQNAKIIYSRDGIDIKGSDLAGVEEETGVTYDDSQKSAIKCSLAHGLAVITGGPGTGKTTVLKAIIAAARRYSNREIVCMAPTNCAAERMREATGEDAKTIHGALAMVPAMGWIPRKEIPAGSLVIVDEFSMVDTMIADALFDAVEQAKGAALILVGDENQLASVGPGAVLRDIIECGKVPVSRLQYTHRQDGGALAEAIPAILAGDYPKQDRQTLSIRDAITDEEALKQALGVYVNTRNKTAAFDPLSIRILTPVKNNKFALSAGKINAYIHAMYYGEAEYVSCSGQRVSVGEPVIMTANHPDIDLYNGDIGLVMQIKPLVIRIGDRDITLPAEAQTDLNLAYATTVHKAQGGQAKCVITVLPNAKGTESLMTRRLLYVAVSRAQKRAVIVAQGEALQRALSNFTEEERRTGLKDKLKRWK